MKEKEEQIIRQIDRYVRGGLTSEETDRLWEVFVEHPEYYRLLEAEVAARDYFLKKEANPSARRPGGPGAAGKEDGNPA